MAESQLRKGALELVVLGLLSTAPSYGGQLLERLKQEVDLEVSQGTAYPLLSRLHKAGVLQTRWEESPTGPPRKIYELTDSGRIHLLNLAGEWAQLNTAVATALKGVTS